jgi:hypothetical protein
MCVMQVASRAAAEAARQTAAANEAFARIREGFAGGMADMASTLQQLVGHLTVTARTLTTFNV